MAITIKFRRGIAIEWSTKNPVLQPGELGFELDTDRFKIGDGTTPWNLLSHYINRDDVLELITGVISELPDGGGLAELMIGDLDDLTTNTKTNVVSSINEVNTPPISLTLLYTNAKA